jgi:hypothetical protein
MRPRRVLYLHGELSIAEIKQRTVAASIELSGPYTNFFQGRAVEAHLLNDPGQKVLEELINEYRPDDLVLDPWQSVIAGYDENSFKDMSRATKSCDYLIDTYNLTLWIPIHQGKVHQRGARGHSTIAGWRDTRIVLSRSGANVNVQVEPRWASPPPVFALHFDRGTMWPAGEASFGGQTGEIRLFPQEQRKQSPKEPTSTAPREKYRGCQKGD